MTDALFLFSYIFLFPGLLFLFIYALFFEFLDRKIAARMQHRIGPPFFQPFADFIKMLGKEVINPKGVDQNVFDAAPLVALAAVITAYFYIPIIGNSPFGFQGDLVLVLFLLSVPTIVLLILGWLSRNIFSAMGGIRAITQMFIYEVPFFLGTAGTCHDGRDLVSFRDSAMAAEKPVADNPPAYRLCGCPCLPPGKTGEDTL